MDQLIMDPILNFIFEKELVEDDLEVVDIVDFGFPKRKYNRSNYFEDLDELQFYQRFRLKKTTVHKILTEVEDNLEYPHNWNDSVPPINQILTLLRFFATGGHISTVADYMGMHISTASRIISKVSEVIARLGPRYIRMPEGNEIIDIQMNFHQKAGFPRVIGCIDGTHIRIQSPGGNDAELYRNRKGYFSLNVQIVGDSNLKIRDLVARWPGSTHDSTIYNHSRLRARLESNEFPNNVILGDSGYFLTENILTPLLNPQNRAEQLYNEAHIRTRNSIERLIGVWKRRFPILAYGMRIKMNTVLKIIVAAGVLHNIAIDMNDDNPPPPDDLDINRLNYLIEIGDIPPVVGLQDERDVAFARNLIINNYFANLI